MSLCVAPYGCYQNYISSAWIPFAVYVASPFLEKSPNDVEAFEGQDVTFPCIASGVPRPNVTWLSNGKPIGGK